MHGFHPVTEARYDEMLGVVPPLHQSGAGFLVGEAVSHNAAGRPTFRAFVRFNGDCFEADQPMTVADFDAVIRNGKSG